MKWPLPTKTQILLLAAGRLPAEFPEWDLTLHAWLIAPRHFGMRGYEKIHPDHKSGFVALYGRFGVLKLGLIERVRRNTYRLTAMGRQAAEELAARLVLDDVA